MYEQVSLLICADLDKETALELVVINTHAAMRLTN